MDKNKQSPAPVKPRHNERLWHNILFEIESDKYYLPNIKPTEKITHYRSFLTDKHFNKKDIKNITYRTINHWSSEGLLCEDRSKESNEWRKFSIVDLLWISILQQLRKFGLSTEQLKQAYKCAFFIGGDENHPRQALEFAAYLCTFNIPVFAVVYTDGWFEIISQQDLEINLEDEVLKECAYITISINECLQPIIPNIDVKANFKRSTNLSKSEIEVLQTIRSGQYESVDIKLKDGSIERISTTNSKNSRY